MRAIPWFTGFTDEAGPSIGEQIRAALDARLAGVDLRSLDHTNVTELTDEQLTEFSQAAHDVGLVVQSVGSPVNKVSAKADLRSGELEKLRRSIHAAQVMGTQRVRIFSPEGPPQDWPFIQEWMAAMVDLAEDEDIILLHENDARFFGAYPSQAKQMFEVFPSAHFRAAFDFSNSRMIGFDPVDDWLGWILPYLDTLHMKDFSIEQSKPVAVGEGDGRVEEFITKAVTAGWEGPFTLEPHLETAGAFGGTSGPEKFSYAADQMKKLVSRAFSSRS